MSEQAPSFIKLALKPKWIGALLVSLIVAAIFAALGQWQLDRTFTKNTAVDVVMFGQDFEIQLEKADVFIVSGRKQGDTFGYWLVSNTSDSTGLHRLVALGWLPDLSSAEAARTELMNSVSVAAFQKVTLVEIDAEAPRRMPDPEKKYLVDAFSTAQLVNLLRATGADQIDAKAFVAIDCNCASKTALFESDQLDPIVFQIEQDEINWLSAFYFVEWIVFAGFAIFLWWRLVRDEQIRLLGESVN
jgi:cytochrome oxidase assembly protein ShyY1